MVRVFHSTLAGAEGVVFSHDHCPPHVTIRHRPEAWVARVRFSFVTGDVALWDVEPQRNAPRRADITLLLDEVQDRLDESRRHWWLIHGTACLENRWFEASTGLSPLTLLARKRPGALQLESARYNVATRQLSLRFREGLEIAMAAGSGDER